VLLLLTDPALAAVLQQAGVLLGSNSSVNTRFWLAPSGLSFKVRHVHAAKRCTAAVHHGLRL
jgi:hypothetical protein